MEVVALGGGVGAGKFLRGLVRAVGDDHVSVIANTGDDIVLHGLHVSPDLDSVTYWLGDTFDRERGWGRREETFRAMDALRRIDPDLAWFTLGDLDLGTHLARTAMLAAGRTLTEATAGIAGAFGLRARLLPMSDDRVTTMVTVRLEDGDRRLHFQDYWVRRGARDPVVAIEYEGAPVARPAPGVLEAIASADALVICPSNPVASIAPILAVPGIADAVAARRPAVVGVSGIVAGAPLAGMADRLLPAVGAEVSAAGAAGRYAGLIDGWVIDTADAALTPSIEATGVRVAMTDTIMVDDAAAERVARTALGLLP